MESKSYTYESQKCLAFHLELAIYTITVQTMFYKFTDVIFTCNIFHLQ